MIQLLPENGTDLLPQRRHRLCGEGIGMMRQNAFLLPEALLVGDEAEPEAAPLSIIVTLE